MVTGTVRRVALPAATIAGIAVLVWAAASGPARIIGPPHLSAVQHPYAPPTSTASPADQAGPPGHAVAEPGHPSLDLSWVGDLLAWTALLLLALALLAFLVWAWRHRWRRPPAPLAVPIDVLPTAAVTETLEETSADRVAALGRGSPRNGIVACWLTVEEAIAAAGQPRRAWETSTEFTVRVLHTLDIDPRPIGTLARLYREARFSRHPMTEHDRDLARAAVDRLDEELRALGAPQRAAR